jgi:prepilin-type N-terminal cleavage/methylation domain-containing protein
MRRGFSLIEILLALALLSALVGPAVVLLARSEGAVATTLLRARRVADRLVAALDDMDPDELSGLARVTAGGGFVALDVGRFASISADELAGLDLTASLRLSRHVGGRFGLDRMDLKVQFKESKRTLSIHRTVVRRNEPQLAALARVRLHGDVETLSDQELADGLEWAAHEHGVSDRMGFLDGSPFPVRTYPALLGQFAGPVGDELAAEQKSRTEALGDRLKWLRPTFTTAGDVPRPRFASNVGVGH